MTCRRGKATKKRQRNKHRSVSARATVFVAPSRPPVPPLPLPASIIYLAPYRACTPHVDHVCTPPVRGRIQFSTATLHILLPYTLIPHGFIPCCKSPISQTCLPSPQLPCRVLAPAVYHMSRPQCVACSTSRRTRGHATQQRTKCTFTCHIACLNLSPTA